MLYVPLCPKAYLTQVKISGILTLLLLFVTLANGKISKIRQKLAICRYEIDWQKPTCQNVLKSCFHVGRV